MYFRNVGNTVHIVTLQRLEQGNRHQQRKAVKVSTQICRMSSLIVTGKRDNERMEIAISYINSYGSTQYRQMSGYDSCMGFGFFIHLTLPAALWP
jgi:hypothetical protein